MKLPNFKLVKLSKALLTAVAVILGAATNCVVSTPTFAGIDQGTVQGATTTIQLFLVGKKTSGAVSVPLADGKTAQPELAATCHYGQAYAVKWTLRMGNTTVGTRSQVFSSTTLQPAGADVWNINLDTLGGGYGDYTISCVVEGTAKDTNTTSFAYVPVKASENEKNGAGNPVLTLDRKTSNVSKVRFTLKKSGRSDLVIVADTAANTYTLPLGDYDLPTGDYTLTAEGGNASGWLGNIYSTSISYTKPAGSGVPSMDGQKGGSKAAAAAAAGAVIMGAGKTSKKRKN